ncbi:hypothetical protein PAPYR_6516 [Paratrimastix pyriformis]|uniref:Uncharacterized protein n=1 Tax=Paratrimastix pyriformis TaxID=342808 RepID=A0ABQ8UEX1_9EUKA|nr:hypothetical protein PAPYR_6516 [Paratrimastix pyriformis]
MNKRPCLAINSVASRRAFAVPKIASLIRIHYTRFVPPSHFSHSSHSSHFSAELTRPTPQALSPNMPHKHYVTLTPVVSAPVERPYFPASYSPAETYAEQLSRNRSPSGPGCRR